MTERPDPRQIHWPPGLHYDAAMEIMAEEKELPWQERIERQLEVRNHLLAGILRQLMAMTEQLGR